MQKFGLVVYAFLIAVSLLGILALSADVLTSSGGSWRPAALAAAMAGPPLAFGAGWLSILWGRHDSGQLLKTGVALVAHCFAGALVALSPYPAIGAVALGFAIVADFLAIQALSPTDEPTPV